MNDSLLNFVVKNFLKISFALLMMGLFFYIMLPFMISIILGGILAMALIPFVDFFIRRGLSRNTALLLFSFLLGAVGLVPVVAFFVRGSRVVSELLHESNFGQISARIATSSYKLIDNVSNIYGLDNMMMRAKVSSIILYIGHFLSTTLSNFVAELPTVFMVGFITILAVYCFLRESEKIRYLFDRYFYFNKKNGNDFIRMCKGCCREVFFSNIITGVLQATIIAIAAIALNVGDFFLVFFITFVVSFIPIIGAAPVAVVLGLICFIESRVGSGIAMMVVAAFSGIADNILRPLLGTLGEANVHPFIGLLAVIGGVIMFGLPGLFIGPLVASLIFGALPIIIEEYFPPDRDMES
ncbi:MAG TPA: AI-2E family transporter [Bacteriovoracaceae bacterium]|nr:AI-2E family transporter [Bacteriovoracaceae bacterium]